MCVSLNDPSTLGGASNSLQQFEQLPCVCLGFELAREYFSCSQPHFEVERGPELVAKWPPPSQMHECRTLAAIPERICEGEPSGPCADDANIRVQRCIRRDAPVVDMHNVPRIVAMLLALRREFTQVRNYAI